MKNLYLRIINRVKRILIKKLGIESDQSFYLDSHMKVQRKLNIERLNVYSDSCSVNYNQPHNGAPVTNFYPKRYTYKLSSVTIDLNCNLIYDSDGNYIAESSSWRPLRLLYSWPIPRIRNTKRTKYLKGTYLFLPNDGYYHWLLEDLPAFIGALNVCPELPIIVSDNLKPYVKCFLDSLPNKVVISKGRVRVEKLVIVGKTAGHGNPMLGATLHPQDVLTLRSYFSDFIIGTDNQEINKLYLSRVGFVRSPSNEKNLESKFIERGYKSFNASQKLDFFEQIKLFAGASHIVGIHGAALSNLVWCKSGTKVWEIYAKSYIPSFYSILSRVLDLNYSSISYGLDIEEMIPENKIISIVESITKNVN